MKNIILLITQVLLLEFGLYAQQTKEPWELPGNNGLVFYKKADAIPVKKNELCDYFYTQEFFDQFYDKLSASALKMTKTNFFKGTNSYSFNLQLNSENDPEETNPDYCNPEENDTIYGRIEYNLKWISSAITNGSHATKNTTVSFFITLLFMNNQDLFVSLKGLSIDQEEFHPGLSKTKLRNEYLSDYYKKFIQSGRKNESDMALFSKINELSSLFYSTLFSSLKMQVKLLDE